MDKSIEKILNTHPLPWHYIKPDQDDPAVLVDGNGNMFAHPIRHKWLPDIIVYAVNKLGEVSDGKDKNR